MYRRWIDRMSYGMFFLLAIAVSHCFILTESASNEFMPQTVGDACPGDVLMYNCTINGGGSTIWSGSAFDCETRNDEIILRHSQFEPGSPSGNCNDGAVTAQSLGVVDTCFSSQLSIAVDLEMNNKTVQCAHSTTVITPIGVGIISIATAPPADVRLSEVRPGELTFNWRTSTDRETGLNYTVNSTCGVCPIVTNTTMVTCSAPTLSTTPTMCTFSVRRVACGTIGSPSLPIIVTLAVPDAPNVTVVPHHSLKDNKQSLTGIIVRVEDVTTFSITDTIPGFITSYRISYGSNMQNKFACMSRTCEYTVDLPPSICSTTGPGVDIAVAAANVLGFGPPTESIAIECNSQFARVNYYSINTTLSCTFLSELDTSPKSCTVRYGICGQEEYTIQGNVSDESPFEISIGLNSSIVESINNCCYIITARNGTYEIIVNGSCTSLPASEGVDNARDLRLVSLIVLLTIPITIIILVVLGFIIFWRRKVHGRCADDDMHQHGHELEEQKEEDHPELLYKDLYPINSKHFVEFTLTSKLSEFRKQKEVKKEDLIFVEYKFKPKRAKICDVILKYKNGRLYTGPYARNIFNNGKDLSAEWENVFVLPHDCIKQQLKAETIILYQNPAENRVKFKVFVMKKSSTLIDFMRDENISSDETDQLFYELLADDEGHNLVHYVEVATIDGSQKFDKFEGSVIQLDSGIHHFYTLLKAPGENITHPGEGLRVFIQGTNTSVKRKSLIKGSMVLYKIIEKSGTVTVLKADDHLVAYQK